MKLEKLFKKFEEAGYTQEQVTSALEEYYKNNWTLSSKKYEIDEQEEHVIDESDVRKFIKKVKSIIIQAQVLNLDTNMIKANIVNKIEDLAGEDLI